MSEINTKIFKPQKWVLDVLNSPKGETIEFDFDGGREAIKISDKVPDIINGIIPFYAFRENAEIADFVCSNAVNSVEHLPNLFINEMFYIYILTEDTDGISRGVYVDPEFYDNIETFKVTSAFFIFETNQNFSIDKITIEGEPHPIEEKYLPGGGTVIYVIDCEYLAARSSGFAILPYTEVDFQNLMVNLIDNGCCILALRVNNTTISQKEVFTSIKISPFYRNCVFTRIVDNYELFPLMEWSDSGEYSSYNGYLYLDMISYD